MIAKNIIFDDEEILPYDIGEVKTLKQSSHIKRESIHIISDEKDQIGDDI